MEMESASTKHESGSDSEASTSTTAGFAFVFYATADPYAYSVLVNIHRLQHLLNVSMPTNVLASSQVSERYIEAFKATGVTTHIQEVPQLKSNSSGYYQDCLLKLLAFKMHVVDPSLRRVLAFDSDQLVMQNLGHLFLGLPDIDLAAPRAYWLAKDFLASTLLMITVSDRLWRTVKVALDTVQYNNFVMDLINDLLGEDMIWRCLAYNPLLRIDFRYVIPP